MALSIGGGTLYGQVRNEQPSQEKVQKKRENRMQHWREMRINYLAEKMHLSPKEKEGFAHVYREYEEGRHKILHDFMKKYGRRHLSEEEIKDKIFDGFKISKDLLKNQERFASKFLKVITAKQLDDMFRLEKIIRGHLIKKRREHQKHHHDDRKR